MIIQARQFDPATSDRWFHVCLSDYLSTVLFPAPGPPAAEAGAAHPAGPACHPRTWRSTSSNRGKSTSAGCRRKSACPTIRPNCCSRSAIVVVGWSGNPLMAQPDRRRRVLRGQPCGRERWATGAPATRSPKTSCSSAGRERQVEIIASSFVQVPELLLGTARLTADARAPGAGAGRAAAAGLAAAALRVPGHAGNDPVPPRPGVGCQPGLADRPDPRASRPGLNQPRLSVSDRNFRLYRARTGRGISAAALDEQGAA